MKTDQRFPIKRSLIWRPLLALFGAWSSNSYVEIEGDSLRLRFGPFFDHVLPLREVASSGPYRWFLIFGVGWRTSFRGSVGLIGSCGGVVEIRLRARRKVPFVVPWRWLSVDRIYVSLEDPDRFLKALKPQTAPLAA